MAHPAEKYNKIKNMLFAILNKDGRNKAYSFLYSKASDLSDNSWKGLKAELDFYVGYQQKFMLTPSLDYGIKCDFTGMISQGEMCRIDVTTNLDVKKLKDFDPIIQRDSFIYKIALMNPTTGVLEDVFDMNFLPDNQGGKIFNVALFLPMDYNRYAEPRYNPYQRIVSVSSSTGEILSEEKIATDWYLPDIHTKEEELYECYEDYDGEDDLVGIELGSYLSEAAKLLTKETDLNIVACGQTCKKIIDPRTCEEEEFTKIYWQHPAIEGYLDDELWEY